jgi:hypothetical protein
MNNTFQTSTRQFSRQTVIAAIELIEHVINAHADLTRFLLKLSAELARYCNDGSLRDRFNHLIKFLDDQPDFQLEDGTRLTETLVEKGVSLFSTSDEARGGRFLRSLEADGFTITEDGLRRQLPRVVNLAETRDEIFRLLDRHGFNVPKGHLDQAFEAHTNANWTSANSQIRSFFEGLLDDFAERLDPTAASLPSGQQRRIKLAAIGFLDRSLNEWDDNGLEYLNGLMRRLHPQGSHPGLSDQEDSTFRLNTVLLFARLLLARFDARSTS